MKFKTQQYLVRICSECLSASTSKRGWIHLVYYSPLLPGVCVGGGGGGEVGVGGRGGEGIGQFCDFPFAFLYATHL